MGSGSSRTRDSPDDRGHIMPRQRFAAFHDLAQTLLLLGLFPRRVKSMRRNYARNARKPPTAAIDMVGCLPGPASVSPRTPHFFIQDGSPDRPGRDPFFPSRYGRLSRSLWVRSRSFLFHARLLWLDRTAELRSRG